MHHVQRKIIVRGVRYKFRYHRPYAGVAHRADVGTRVSRAGRRSFNGDVCVCRTGRRMYQVSIRSGGSWIAKRGTEARRSSAETYTLGEIDNTCSTSGGKHEDAYDNSPLSDLALVSSSTSAWSFDISHLRIACSPSELSYCSWSLQRSTTRLITFETLWPSDQSVLSFHVPSRDTTSDTYMIDGYGLPKLLIRQDIGQESCPLLLPCA